MITERDHLEKIELDIVIPTYNRAGQIRDAVLSVLKQNNEPGSFVIRQVLVIDDGSIDNTEQIIKEISDSRVRYHRNDENRGAAYSRNVGVSLSKCEWIAFQDSDDHWYPEKLERQSEIVINHPDCDLVYTGFKAVFPDKTICCGEDPDKATIDSLCVRNFIGTPTVLVKKEAFQDIGGFDTKMRALEDWDFILRFAEKYKITGIPDLLVRADYTLEGLSSDIAKYYESRCYMIAKNREMLQRNQCFEMAVQSLLENAKEKGVLKEVGNMLELSIKMYRA